MTEQELRDVLPTLALLDDASACQLLCVCLIDFLLDEGYDALAHALTRCLRDMSAARQGEDRMYG
jgi:hypothetical protein